MQLRPYQEKANNDVDNAYSDARAVVLVLPTGAGKTVTFAHRINTNNGPTVAIAHRQELVGQISTALAREGVKHNILAPKKVIKSIINKHVKQFGRSFYDANNPVMVAGVDTLIRRKDDPFIAAWSKTVTLWVIDEAHHLLKNNKWGKAADMFPNARGLGVTATPTRADGNGLGVENDGLFEKMIVGPTMRELIEMEFLTDYRIFAPPSDLNLDDVNITASGEFNREGVKKAVKRSNKFIGDIVKHYLKIANGKKGVTFVPDVETAHDVADQFNAANVPAIAISANTPDNERDGALYKLETGQILQIVNVDLLGEGFDCPSIEVVSFARPTQSLSLYIQQFGRALRLMEGKTHAIIIDHVGNVERHGLPDAARTWTLDRKEKRAKTDVSDAIPVKTCPECLSVFERIHKACIYCGHEDPPAVRNAPEFVDGDLLELDADTLAAMRGEITKADQSVESFIQQAKYASGGRINVAKMTETHETRQHYQAGLRGSIQWWAAFRRDEGLNDSQIYRLFYLKFGVDIMTAQTLKTKDAAKLVEKINLTFTCAA